MKKIISLAIVLLFAILVIAQTSYNDYAYYVEDKVKGSDLEIDEFVDELGLIDTLIYNEMLKRNKNFFSAEIGYGINSDWTEDIYKVENLRFDGSMNFDDKSSMSYELTDFEVIDTDVDEYGMTETYGNANFTYRATIKIERTVPVEAYFGFWQDVDDKDSFEQEIDIRGEDVRFILYNGDKQKFSHRRKCYAGCD